MNLFNQLGLSQKILLNIKKLGFTTPTTIQKKSIPHIIKGEDIIGESATGSGKTLAFGCSIAEKVKQNEGLQALVLTPTRELAEQVKKNLKELSPHLRISVVYGGVSINNQIYELRKAEVVVATPGRCLDHLHRGTMDTGKVKVLILDEADRMFDMGMIEDVEQIIQTCPKQRQTLFFSATIAPAIKKIANNYMRKPIAISTTNQVDPKKLKQCYYDVSKNMKLSLLIHLLQNEKAGLAMVFCNTRRTSDFVDKNLRKNGVKSIAIHGGLSQNKRTRIIKTFNDARVGVLVCTDVAARGLHIDNVSHVYNYDIPNDPKEYIHRVGRTARAGEEGQVINFLSDHDYENFGRVLNKFSLVIKNVKKPYVKQVQAIKVMDRRNNSRRPMRRHHYGF